MARDWWVKRGAKVVGPVSDAKLIALARSGQLLGNDAVSTDGGETWTKAGVILARIRRVPPPVPKAGPRKGRIDEVEDSALSGSRRQAIDTVAVTAEPSKSSEDEFEENQPQALSLTSLDLSQLTVAGWLLLAAAAGGLWIFARSWGPALYELLPAGRYPVMLFAVPLTVVAIGIFWLGATGLRALGVRVVRGPNDSRRE